MNFKASAITSAVFSLRNKSAEIFFFMNIKKVVTATTTIKEIERRGTFIFFEPLIKVE